MRASIIPSAQVPVAPAKASPAPKKPGMIKSQGFTKAPSSVPISTIEPTISCT